MSTPADIVAEQFGESRSTAASMTAQAVTFVGAFTDALFPAATVDVTFAPVDAPTALTLPDRPAVLDGLDAEFEWDAGGNIAGSMPDELSVSAPSIAIDDFDEAGLRRQAGADLPRCADHRLRCRASGRVPGRAGPRLRRAARA